ncbi:MAG: DnaA regulatory inactivator Hda [Nevskia sp.]|nr:DnaA regulatory inactivator Hda [Nevskia sp.]
MTASASRPQPIGPQLALAVALRETATFDSFEVGANAAAVAALRRLAAGGAEAGILLHGPAGRGKTHLLQATAREATQRGRRAAYLPIARLAGEDPAALVGFERLELLCFDEIEPALESATLAPRLLRLLDAVRAHGGGYALAAASPPQRLPCDLPDLRTRLSACAVFGLKPLDERGLRALLIARARSRGLELTPEVADFLLRRLPRAPAALLEALEELDRGSLSAQRRLTIPFVQQMLARSDGRTGSG